MADAFETHVREAARAALEHVPADERADTYVVSFLVYDEDDDPRTPTLTVGTNTESQVRLVLEPTYAPAMPVPWGGTPTDADEARWNYAFWKQNQLAVVADSTEDPLGGELREQWVRAGGLWLEDPEDDDWDRFDRDGLRITEAFVALCARVSQELHADGVVTEVLGRPIPIVVHELEYYEEIAEQTVRANPPGLADAFSAWVRSDSE